MNMDFWGAAHSQEGLSQLPWKFQMDLMTPSVLSGVGLVFSYDGIPVKILLLCVALTELKFIMPPLHHCEVWRWPDHWLFTVKSSLLRRAPSKHYIKLRFKNNDSWIIPSPTLNHIPLNKSWPQHLYTLVRVKAKHPLGCLVCLWKQTTTHSIRNDNPMFDQQPLTLFNCTSQ